MLRCMRGRLRRAGAGLAAAGFSAGAMLATGLLYAKALAREDSTIALRRALWTESQLADAPDADHLERLAEREQTIELEQTAEPQRTAETDSGQPPALSGLALPELALKEAVRIDPRRSAAWIMLGLLAERQGEWTSAERDLLEAARVDHQYLPAWTLTNFYFRRGNRERFWVWARRAAPMTFDEFPPLLRLADHFEPDPVNVLQWLGDSARLERGYLSYLIQRNRLDAAQRVAVRLAARSDPADAPRFAALASRQIAAGNAGAALEAWNVLHAPPLDPARGPFLTNRDFRSPPSGEGFDWILASAPCPGVAAAWSPGQVRFDFSGGQPDACVLLTQTLILVPRGTYRLRFEFRGEGRPSTPGFDWDLEASAGKATRPRSASFIAAASGNWGSAERIFPQVHGPLARLRFGYHRQSGTVRYEGSVWLRQLRWEVL